MPTQAETIDEMAPKPVTTISDYERALLTNEWLVAVLERGRDQIEDGRGRVFTGRRSSRS
ncbi:hypothetical protein [Microbacterium sp. VKM Ac-2923]|uniref:hypothetical protein n=1 Tax=Microbacterium sp. VKM Ac-2923 TaxID=2929476 RepID=UPI001FB45C2A|nr:hypothetical protein [Microbacterium sp. VKM Ac-2923]MCJ1707162.1 hypothetical protein [Microbacterium sp. VKM Ac-2923]